MDSSGLGTLLTDNFLTIYKKSLFLHCQYSAYAHNYKYMYYSFWYIFLWKSPLQEGLFELKLFLILQHWQDEDNLLLQISCCKALPQAHFLLLNVVWYYLCTLYRLNECHMYKS